MKVLLSGGAVASQFVRSSPDRAVWVGVLARDVLSSLARRFTFTVPPLLRCINGMGAGEFIAGGNPAMD